ncbi:hypothetical protein [Granulicella arctica]|uniref:hypothetical protein n=1 Tax=Granulicella arctica TaxID=940613 RepID=UPI0021DFCD70|nr:hypothetical protein [Granulicella arctica]
MSENKVKRVGAGQQLIAAIGSLAAGLLLCLTLSGCLVAGYSSGAGFFLWPGSISLLVVVLFVVFLLRRRR